MKQVTLLAWVPAPPAVMRDVIVRRRAVSRVHPQPVEVDERAARPTGAGSRRGASSCPSPASRARTSTASTATAHRLMRGDDEARYRYEMLPVGGGTLLVQYGYTDVKHSNAFVRSFVKRQPMMEHGLALSAQMMFVTAMRAEAIRRAGGADRSPRRRRRPPSFAPLLARGQVAVMRARRGQRARPRLRARAARRRRHRARQRVRDVRARRRQELPRASDGFAIEMSLPIVTWASTWAVQPSPHAVDEAAIDGDLRGAHIRWDLSPHEAQRDARRLSRAPDARAVEPDPAQALRVPAVAASRASTSRWGWSGCARSAAAPKAGSEAAFTGRWEMGAQRESNQTIEDPQLLMVSPSDLPAPTSLSERVHSVSNAAVTTASDRS